MNEKGGQTEWCQETLECCCKNLADENCIGRKLDVHLVQLWKGTEDQVVVLQSWAIETWCQNAKETDPVEWAHKSAGVFIL